MELSDTQKEELVALINWAEDLGGGVLDLSVHGDAIAVDLITVEENMRGAGIGTRIMRALNRWADRHGVTLALTPDPHPGISKHRLTEWYRGLGYKPNKGSKRKVWSTRQTMARIPRTS